MYDIAQNYRDITNKTLLCGKMLVYLFNVSEAEKKDERLINVSNNTIQASSCWKA